MDEEDFLVTVEDLRTVRKGKSDGWCLPGFYRWADANGISRRAALRDGIRASVLRNINDPYVNKLLAVARERLEKERNNGIS